MRRVVRIFGWLTLICLAVLLSYEAMAVVRARHATPAIFESILSKESGTINLRDIPASRIAQLLAIEDPGFYQHKGIDIETPGAGLTTITQAMVKYLYFEKFRPGFMKIEQTLIAWLAVDSLISKDDQLAVFINTAYLGQVDGIAVRGFPAAAKIYFGKTLSELNDDEYLSIVAMLIGPVEFSVKYHPDKNRERVERIKKVLSGEYRPKGNWDVYYGQQR